MVSERRREQNRQAQRRRRERFAKAGLTADGTPRKQNHTRGPIGDEEDPRHGTVNGYHNLKCRCALCRRAWSDHCAAYQRKRRAERRSEVALFGPLGPWRRGARMAAAHDD